MIFYLYFLSGLLFFANSGIQTWKLIWSDEFNHEGLPKVQYWNFKEGFSDPQKVLFYTSPDLYHARIVSGHLFIEARNSNNVYSSAFIHTKDKVKFQYGRVEIKAKFPVGKATPSFCLVSYNDQSKIGELKITSDYQTNEIKGIILNNNDELISRNAPVKVSPVNHHVFAIEWDSEEIKFLVDEILYLRYKKDASGMGLFDHPLYLSIDLGINNSSKTKNSSSRYQLIIDYVRYFKKNAHKRGYEIPIVIK